MSNKNMTYVKTSAYPDKPKGQAKLTKVGQ